MSNPNFQDSNPVTSSIDRGSTGDGVFVLDAYQRLLKKYDDLSVYWFLRHRFYTPDSKEEKKCLAQSDLYNKLFLIIVDKILLYAKKKS